MHDSYLASGQQATCQSPSVLAVYYC